jgi:hypothetical protein
MRSVTTDYIDVAFERTKMPSVTLVERDASEFFWELDSTTKGGALYMTTSRKESRKTFFHESGQK